jgi:hypothetical protein
MIRFSEHPRRYESNYPWLQEMRWLHQWDFNVLQHVSCTSRRFQPDGVASGVDNGQGQGVRNEFTSSTGISQKGIRSAPVMANVLQHVSCTSRRFQPGGVASGWRLLSGAGRLFLLHHHQNHPSQNRTFVLKSKP